jgi:hypothetical protein
MNDAYYTQTGERPELAALEVNAPEGYIGNKILPVVPVADKTGTVYYATVQADAAAATSRSVGTAPTAVQISDSAASYTTVEQVKRGAVTPDEAKQMGGIDKADVVGAKWAKRQVMNAVESLVRADILGIAASDTFDAAKILVDGQAALQSIRLYEGKTAMIGATSTLKKVVQGILADDTLGPIFARTIAGTAPNVAIQGMNFQSWLNALAVFLSVDEVLAGDDTIWASTGYSDKFAFAKIDDGMDPLSHKWKPVLGKVFQFMPDGKNPWVIQSVADRVNVNNLYDAYCWCDSVILNSSAVYVFDGVA